MAVFEGDKGQRQQTLVNSTTAVAVFLLTHSSTSTSNAWTFKTGTRDVTVMNTGPNSVWLGTSTSVTTATGFKVGVGEQLTLQGVASKISGVTATGPLPATVIAGLASNAWVV